MSHKIIPSTIGKQTTESRKALELYRLLFYRMGLGRKAEVFRRNCPLHYSNYLADFIVVDQLDCITEIECKKSIADLYADFTKRDKNNKLGISKHELMLLGKGPNLFYFMVSKGMPYSDRREIQKYLRKEYPQYGYCEIAEDEKTGYAKSLEIVIKAKQFKRFKQNEQRDIWRCAIADDQMHDTMWLLNQLY